MTGFPPLSTGAIASIIVVISVAVVGAIVAAACFGCACFGCACFGGAKKLKFPGDIKSGDANTFRDRLPEMRT